ncbi:MULTISPECIES: prolipoprotein diacylglyceryl transferase [Flavobacteriaceae]|uniref:Phosphatidylglycerol--prolipoprotein diacylglyceryl transferase n=2 Tax=Flavobacteriaceae TaxID=49546 RepID=A0A4Y8AWI6_9FLAO|nr:MULTISPECIES: prolipoprotein diacylglyceryl transferase [Flavobacteriaceae]TEW76843.1 prolipoprotein diacylglyceryl transferase [Gramella jeungdoensis]GGK49547.1 prolipoprotein diacylglyceryl transferase [Lutibacter litoralis]
MILLQIDWNPSPEIFKIGSFAIRYYSLMFVFAFMLGLYLMKKIFINEKIPIEKLDSLFIYTVVAILLGARLGHFLFYDPEFLIKKPLEVILPFQFSPTFKFTGFAGLASHGAAIGAIIAMYLYSKKVLKKPILYILDRIVIPSALGAMFVRLGNLMNSEIIGKATNSDYGFVFKRLGEDFPRHPAQLYEAISYLAIFVILYFVYWKTDKKEKSGYLFGLFFVLLWTVRFFVEFFKEAQVEGREDWIFGLNTGQVLSIPLIIIGLYFMFKKQSAK